MAIPAVFGLTVPTSTLGEYDNSNITAATSGYLINTTAGTIRTVLWEVPTSTLTSPIITTISNAPSNDIKTITAGSIRTVLWEVPTSTLTSPIITTISNAPSNDIKTIASGTSQNYGAYVPSVGLGALFSTHIYTSNAPITISTSSFTPTQTWSMS